MNPDDIRYEYQNMRKWVDDYERQKRNYQSYEFHHEKYECIANGVSCTLYDFANKSTNESWRFGRIESGKYEC